MMGFQFAAGCRQAAFNNFLMGVGRLAAAVDVLIYIRI